MRSIRQTVLTVQERKSTPRIWIEGLYLRQAGFVPGCKFNVRLGQDKIVIRKNGAGSRTVSAKKYPIIDINNESIKRVFQISERVQVTVEYCKITIEKTKHQKRIDSRLKDGSCGGAFVGGGLFEQAAANNGFQTKWGIEINQKYADVWQQNHSGIMHNMSIADVEFGKLAPVELLVAGIPCEPFSQLRQNEDLAETIDLSIFFMMLVEAVNPRTIVLEEVPHYIKSELGQSTMRALARMGYVVKYKMITGPDFGELEKRRRVVIVAHTDDFEFPKGIQKDRTMGEILQSPDDPECQWWNKKTKPWIFNSWKKAKQEGTKFAAPIITEESSYIPAITKRYFAVQGQNPVIKHPTLKDTYRLLTLKEVRKLKGLAARYNLGKSADIAGEILGQAILVKVFEKIIREITA